MNVERVVKRYGWDGSGVGITEIMERTGLSYEQVDGVLHRLHGEGVITYPAADQLDGEKVAYLTS